MPRFFEHKQKQLEQLLNSETFEPKSSTILPLLRSLSYAKLTGMLSDAEDNADHNDKIWQLIREKLVRDLEQLQRTLNNEQSKILKHLDKRAKQSKFDRLSRGSEDFIKKKFLELNTFIETVKTEKDIFLMLEKLGNFQVGSMWEQEALIKGVLPEGYDPLDSEPSMIPDEVHFTKERSTDFGIYESKRSADVALASELAKSASRIKRLFQVLLDRLVGLHLKTSAEKSHEQLVKSQKHLKEDFGSLLKPKH